MSTFMDEYRAGRARADAIHDYIAQWHDAPMGSPAAQVDLHEWLGMSWPEYQRWAATGRLPVDASDDEKRDRDRRELAERFANQERTHVAAIEELADLL